MKTSNFAVSKKYFKRKKLEKFSVGVEISVRNFITYIYIYIFLLQHRRVARSTPGSIIARMDVGVDDR